MPISKMRHEDGEGVFLIQTPRPITRKLMGVRFVDGQGKTKYPQKAKDFDHLFGYMVIPPVGFPAKELWGPPIKDSAGLHAEELEEGSSFIYEADEDDEEEEE